MEQSWIRRSRPERLERRIEFSDYATTREFLDHLGALSEQEGRFPDISFGRTYVNLTLRPEQDEPDACLGEQDEAFARAVDALL
jgi:4a-hydroxytetrahydrobiopterin dehydratase